MTLDTNVSQDIELETQRCLDSLKYILRQSGPDQVKEILSSISHKLAKAGVDVPKTVSTPYVNTIDTKDEPKYPGNLDLEKKLRSYARWNAMAMVVKANRQEGGVGGHISTFASTAALYEVGQNHFFRGDGLGQPADQIFFQGHGSPGNYARSYLEGRLSNEHLLNFRRELSDNGGLSSYPHPYLMPDYWQFPTVSMGLGPIMSIYNARFNRYMSSRGFIDKDKEPNIWCYVGDGESDEPETLGALTVAGREKLDNLTWVINCNLQRLDGPVRGNGKIIQELESLFLGAGWNVIKLVWGSNWDPLLNSPHRDLLIKRMGEAIDGDYQKYIVEPGSYIRKHFFGKYPELLEVVAHLSDDDIKNLLRGGHDAKKIYAAYKAAVDHKGAPTVILAKTVKGYGLGEAGEGKNISHQQKKMNEKELREFKDRFGIPISDEDVVEMPFYKPPKSAPEMKYLLDQRKKLGGFLPKRTTSNKKLDVPDLDYFKEFLEGSGDSELSTTMAYVRILMKMLRHKGIGERIVPIIPDEGRTFGMEPLFRQIGIYSSKGQLYEPVDSESLLYYKEASDGQLLEEGINEAGSMSSFIAAGTAYSTLGEPMIPLYIYYSMFGFQRVGDLMWLAGDIRCRGFLLGGTAGRTTLNGEGLQHQDGHGHLLVSTIPNCVAYDPAFRFELAVIIQDGLRRMYQEQEDIFYYITVGNENYKMLAMPEGAEEGIKKGLYKLKEGKKAKHKVHLFGSGAIILSALRAQEMLEEYGVSADVWSVTSYSLLRREALECQRVNMLNPTKKAKKSYIETVLEKEKGSFVAVSDNMKIVSEQISQWVPGGLAVLGTDGFGRSETRENLRRFFEVDEHFTVLATLYKLSQEGKIDAKVVEKAKKKLGIKADKTYPKHAY